MKNLLAILFLIPFFAQSQTLCNEAYFLKTDRPSIYETIESEAKKEWGNDFNMVVYEINKQSTALLDFTDLFQHFKSEGNKKGMEIMSQALMKWTEGEFKDLSSRVDWNMVMHEANKQLQSWALLQ